MNWRLVYLTLAVLLSALVFGVFVCRPGINGYDSAMFGDMVYGRAAKPFAYRVFVPTTVRVLMSAVPEETQRWLRETVGQTPAVDNLFTILQWEKRYLTEYFIALGVMYACLWGFIASLRYLLSGVYRVSPVVRDVFTLLAILGLTQFFRYYSYLYDLSTVFLFTLGLALLVRSRWRTYLLVFTLACLNKETTILLTLVFAIYYFRRERLARERYWLLLAAQVGIFVAIKALLFVLFRQNPGGFVEAHYPQHNLDVLKAYPLATVFGWCGVALLLGYQWSAKPLFLRRALWIVVPLVVLAFFLGYMDELRDYYEVYPVVLLLALHSVGRIIGFDVTPVELQSA